MSALPPKADIVECDRHVRFVPKADISVVHSITSSARASNVGWNFKAERLGGLEVDRKVIAPLLASASGP